MKVKEIFISCVAISIGMTCINSSNNYIMLIIKDLIFFYVISYSFLLSWYVLEKKVDSREIYAVRVAREAYFEGYDDCYMQNNVDKEPDECTQFSPKWNESLIKEEVEKKYGV